MLQTNNHYARKSAMIINQDLQCNCYGYYQPQKVLLSRQRSLELKNTPSHIHSTMKQEIQGIQKSPGKRSLKKKIKQISQTPKHKVFEEYYTSKIIPQRPVRKESIIQYKNSPVRTFLSPQFQKPHILINRPLQTASNQRQQFNYGSWQRIPIQKKSNHQLPQFQAPNNFQINNKPSPSTPPIKINFSSSPSKYSPPISPRENQKHQSDKYIQYLSDKPQLLHPVYSLQEIKEEVKFNIKTKREPSKKIANEEVVDSLKSLRDEKRTLKKMDDVQQINSMPDSSDFSDDKQSIVLGRLHEYASMVDQTIDPTNSLTIPSLTSKLIMNTQSSAIQKSLLKSFINLDKTNYR